MPKPGFFGELPTTQLTTTGSFVHKGVIPPVLTPGNGDQAYFAAGGKLMRMAPDGGVTELGSESSLNISAPVVGPDETLYYRTDQGQLVATSPQGEEKWRQAAGGTSFFPMGLARDGSSLYSVNVGADGRHAVSVRDLATGNERFPLTLEPGEQLVGLLDEKTLIVTGATPDEHYLQIVRPEGRGRRVSGLDTPMHGPNAWLGADNQLYVRDALGRLQALEASTGHQNWMFPGPMKDLFVAPDGHLMAVMGKKLTRLTGQGQAEWTCEAPAPVTEGSFDAKGNFYTVTAGQLAYLTPTGELETTPWQGEARASGSGMLFQVVSPEPPAALQPQGNLGVAVASAGLGFLGSALGGLLSRKGLRQAVREGAEMAGKAYQQGYQPGNPAPPGPNRNEGEHRVEAVRFVPKKELLASVQTDLQGHQAAIEEREGRVIVGGVPVRRKD